MVDNCQYVSVTSQRLFDLGASSWLACLALLRAMPLCQDAPERRFSSMGYDREILGIMAAPKKAWLEDVEVVPVFRTPLPPIGHESNVTVFWLV